MGTEKSFRLFRRWVCLYPAFLLLLALSAQSQPLGNNGADNGGTSNTLNCPPGSGTTSSCVGTRCVASCGSEKVEMECPEGGIDINGSTVTCGKAKKVTFAPCFPFC